MKGILRSVTRKNVSLKDENGNYHEGILKTAKLKAVVGDRVSFIESSDPVLVTEIQERKNLLRRASIEREKLLVANLDHLFIVCAPHPLFNDTSIDRILVSTRAENIPCTLILNKSDLENEASTHMVALYDSLGIHAIKTQAKKGIGIESIHERIASVSQGVFAFVGISGVGKSTLLQSLLPQENIKTNKVSERTGQGKQTTSFAIGYEVTHSKGFSLLVDLPGVQNFGVRHLSIDEVKWGFPEIFSASHDCKFRDCKHTDEPGCRVLELIEKREIAFSRYKHFLEMIEEVSVKDYS